MAQNPYGLSGVGAASDLGLGDMLSKQQKDETDEERRKRLMGQSALNSPAAAQLLGLGGAGGTRGY